MKSIEAVRELNWEAVSKQTNQVYTALVLDSGENV